MNLRRVLAGIVTILPLAVLLAVVPVLPPPDRVPSHWSGSVPDGWTSGAELLTGVMSVVVLCALGAAALAVLQRVVPQAWSRWALSAGAAVGWGALLVYVVTVWRTGVDGPDAVGQLWALLAVAGALVAGLLGYVVHGRRVPRLAELRQRVPERARTQPSRGRAVRPVASWATQISSATMKIIGWGLAAVTVTTTVAVLASGESLVMVALVVLVLGGAALLAVAWSVVRVQVDADGLTVRSRTLPLRVARVGAEDVVGVEVLDLDPMAWGGIGLRPLPDRTSYIVDGGPGIVVWKRDGRRLALQVTEGDAAARAGARALLQAAGQRLGEGTPSA